MNYLSFELDPEDPQFIYLLWEGDKVRIAHKRLFSKHLKNFQKEPTKSGFFNLFEKAELSIVRREGLSLLARRGYFSSELKERLQRKRFSEKAIDRVVYDLIQKGYIDDAGRLEAWISKEFAKGHGSKWIYQAFKKKVGKEEIQRFLPAIQEGEKASLEKYLSRRASQRALKDRKKLIRQLLQRGYSYQTIRSVGLTSFTH